MTDLPVPFAFWLPTFAANTISMARFSFPVILFILSLSFTQVSGQKPVNAPSSSPKMLPRPKLVVGMMVDQMRWDFLYRYYDRYSEGGFKRLLREGFTCENAMIPYAQTVTAAGHASVYTGSVPAVNGIMGNDWFDRSQNRSVYCVEDKGVAIVGGSDNKEPMSPKNLWTTTISDELRLATNFRSKVVGIAIKDRGAILPAGFTGDAYWYDSKSGNFVTSTYDYPELPVWVADFNMKKLADSLYAKDWNTLYPINTYVQSDRDNAAYEGRFMHEQTPTFPHELKSQMGVNYGTISSTPYGNTLTLAFARAAMKAENLGKDNITDLLAVSLSSPDYAGHQFGPNSIEIEDMYLRLDKELEAFFNHLDKEVGKGQWLFFITADHGVAHTPGFLAKNNIQVSTLSSNIGTLNKSIEEKFRVSNAIRSSGNYHVYFNYEKLDSAGANPDAVMQFAVKELEKDSTVWMAFETKKLQTVNMPAEIKERFINGMNPKFSGDLIVVLKSGFFVGGRTGTTHGSWYPYDAHIPMVFMGWGIKHGSTARPTYMTDFAPTLSALLHIQMPSGNIGRPVTEITDY
jgi:predicted AlkP superfamily pyrophosphatase or phosphodiesterase